MRACSILATLVVVILVLYELFALILPEVVRSIQSIIFQFPIYVNNLSNWALLLLKDNPDLEATVDALINQYSSKMMEYVNTNLLPHINEVLKTVSLSVLGVFKALWNLVIGFIISVYLLGSKEKFAGQAKRSSTPCLTARQAMRSSPISALSMARLSVSSAARLWTPLS